ncbi:hypothetical protein, partial [Acetobacter oeni]|uniref:hypothetical protein n=1 Tax=Acetobacter oeni TaxID=304077 RepID=UPI001C8414D5
QKQITHWLTLRRETCESQSAGYFNELTGPEPEGLQRLAFAGASGLRPALPDSRARRTPVTGTL